MRHWAASLAPRHKLEKSYIYMIINEVLSKWSADLPFEAESAPNPKLQNIFRGSVYASLKVDLCSSIWVKTEHSFLII